jgi:hypothetical protein
LGTIPGDPIPALDRNERAFDLSWSWSGKGIAGDSEHLSGRSSRLEKGNSEGTATRQTGGAYGDGEEFVSQRGPGGLPALSTNANGDKTEGDPEMILATIASLAAPESSGEMIAGTFVRSTDEISRLDPRPSNHLLHADFFTAAFSLAVGISLTAGPLYPDLMMSIRSWLPGLWRHRSRTPSPVLPKRRLSRHRPRSWFSLLRGAASPTDAGRSP